MSSSGAAFDKFGPDTTPARLAVEYLVLVYCRRVMVMVMVMVKGEKLANNPVMGTAVKRTLSCQYRLAG